jgi:hypothetical protein
MSTYQLMQDFNPCFLKMLGDVHSGTSLRNA